MTWLHLLGLALVVAVVAALTGIKPKKSKPVARTHLMGAARVVLVLLALVLVVLAIRGAMG
jgi:hypothetical protein